MDKKLDQKKIIAISVVAVLIIAGASFYGGMLFAGSQRGGFNRSGLAGGPGGTGTGAGAKRATGASYINGDILSLDASSLTVKLASGGSKIVLFSTSTEVSKFTTGAISDLSVGTSVMINGNATTDGSLTAKSIQIRPAGAAANQGPIPPGTDPVK